jgi:hypothetical protein
MSLIPDLELQLRDAASRRRSRANRRVVGWLATASVVAALAAGLVIASGGERRSDDQPPAGKGRHLQPLPVGTVIRKGEGSPPRDSDATVVATGTAPVAGPWQLEVWRDHGGPFPPGEPRGRCLFIILLDPPTYRDGTRDPSGASGFCGGLGFRKTPGFSRAQRNVPTLRKAPRGPMKGGREILVFGRVPERARKVVITADRGVKIEVVPDDGPASIPGDFFVIPVKPHLRHARINWLDAAGDLGSRGIRLMPPITDS